MSVIHLVRIQMLRDMSIQTYDDVLTVEEACEALRMGKNALYELLLSKKLKGFRNGRVWRVPKKAVVEYICAQANL